MLQFITHTNQHYDYFESAYMALTGGCRWIQLRIKDIPDAEYLLIAKELRAMCDTFGATMILDDRVHIVRECRADGVHLGKMDISPSVARRMLGTKAIIGGTANTFDDIKHLASLGVNYIGLGPYRFTTTKKNLSPILGIEGYRMILRQCAEERISIPIVAIGGITIEDISILMSTGIAGIALSGTIINAENPVKETIEIIKIINKINNE